MNRTLVFAGFALLASASAFARDASLAKAPFLDPRLPVERRVADLLARMTLEEKVAQLQGYWRPKQDVLLGPDLRFAPEKAAKLLRHGLGQIARPSEHENPANNRGPRAMAELTNDLQKWVIENTRLGIPLMFHEEGLHGLQAKVATSVPQPLALASSWNPALVERVYMMVAREMRARGAHQALAPVVDVARDPRWGRTEETFGEDPFLVARLGVAAVRGFQGRGPSIDDEHVAATAKHFAVHSQPESGINVGPGNHSLRVIREVFLPPFQALIEEAGVLSLMPSYNEVDGWPSHANTWLMREVLRGEWRFGGLVVSDYDAIEQLADLHHVAGDYDEAAILALRAGVDVELPNPKVYPRLVELVRQKRVAVKTIDESVARVLRMKFLLGLFERPFVDPNRAEALAAADAHRPLALEAAREAVVLLKNDGILPLDPRRGGTVAVIGPNAAACRLGGYSGVPKVCVSLLDGLRETLGPGVKVLHAKGCTITKGSDWWADKVEVASADEDARDIRQAVATAQAADVVILALGDSEQTSREAWSAGHLGDRPSLDLFGRQNELADAILGAGKPVIAVLLNGRPAAVPALAARARALVEGFYLGQEGGRALADVLTGTYNPGGKLPITMPRSAGHLPAFYNHKPSARRGYLLDDVSPLFPFGHGLSYTTFAYSGLEVSPAVISPEGSVTVTVDVTNTGRRTGTEVVQLYLRDLVSRVTRPVKELRGFERVALEPGQARKLRFVLGPKSLGYWDDKMRFSVEPGAFQVMVGGSSATLPHTTTFRVAGAAR